MVIKTFNVLHLSFFAQKLSSGKFSIRIRITIKGERQNIVTGIVLDEQRQWQNPVIKYHKSAKQFNTRLNQIQNRLFECFNRLESLGQEPTVFTLKDTFKGNSKPPLTLLQVYKDFVGIKELESISRNTLDKYKVIAKDLERFLIQNNLKHLAARDVKKHHLYDFYSYCKLTPTSGEPNSGLVAKRKTNCIKTSLQVAFDRERIETYNLGSNLDIKESRKTEEIIFLTPEEVERLRNKRFIERLQDERDVFLFQCATGLAHCDVEAFNQNPRTKLIKRNDQDWIFFTRGKNGKRIEVPLFSTARVILEKYDYNLPIKSNGKRNSYLKEIADICNIDKNLTTHVARRTFGTILLCFEGVSLSVVSRLLSHSSTSVTLKHYAEILPSFILKEVEHLL